MNRRARKAALEILLLMEEYSAEDLAEALSLIGGHRGEDLLGFFARVVPVSSTRTTGLRRGSGGFSTKGQTRALQNLKQSDPEKYRILSEFEGRVREGSILPTLDDFRAFSKVLLKDVKPARSRKLALTQLIEILAQMELPALKAAIAKVPTGRERGEGAYGRLVEHIVGGAPPRSTEQP